MERQRVFGVGLSKTGTTSLAAALNILGVKTIHYPHDGQTYHELKSGDFRLSILNEYDGAVDTPIAPFYAQLDAVYPGSKFILTVRDKNSWLRSAEYDWSRYVDAQRRRGKLDEFDGFIRAAVYGTLDFDPDHYSRVYDAHERNVREYFRNRPGDLLILDICGGDGWEKLCGFLGIEIPKVPFPNENRGVADLLDCKVAIEALVTPGGTYILIDDYLLWDREPVDRHPIRLVERDGQYWGLPADDQTVIQEVERLRQAGAKHLVFAWPAFWWLDHYAGFRRHLESRYSCPLRNERMVVFDLQCERTGS
jgi:hypothetical protein